MADQTTLVIDMAIEADPADIEQLRATARSTRNVGVRQLELGQSWLAMADAYDAAADQLERGKLPRAFAGLASEPDAAEPQTPDPSLSPLPGDEEPGVLLPDLDAAAALAAAEVGAAQMIRRGQARTLAGHEIDSNVDGSFPHDRLFQFANRIVLADVLGLSAEAASVSVAVEQRLCELLDVDEPARVLISTNPAGAVLLTLRTWTPLDPYEVPAIASGHRCFLVPLVDLGDVFNESLISYDDATVPVLTATDARALCNLVPGVLGVNPDLFLVTAIPLLPTAAVDPCAPDRVSITVRPWLPVP